MRALTEPPERLQEVAITPTPVIPPLKSQEEQRHVVFLVHGIRDLGGWRAALGHALKECSRSIEIRTPAYAYFPMVAFLLFNLRQRYVRWFMDRYTEDIAVDPANTIVSFVGHSNGTYVAARALRDYQTLRLFSAWPLPEASCLERIHGTRR